MLAGWLARLDGLAHLVVGKNLGADSLAAWLTAQGWPATRVAARSGYRLLRIAAEQAVVAAP
jgi:16S rRNA (guanine1207-N2)-methyltransferase